MSRQWVYNVPAFKVAMERYLDETDLIPTRDALVKALVDSRWYADEGEYSELGDLIDELKNSEDEDEMNDIVQRIYDLADDQRAWLGL